MEYEKYQQGDVVFRRLGDANDPELKKKLSKRKMGAVDPVNGRFILAEGEATGHAHAIVAGVDDVGVYTMDELLAVEAPNGTTVVHEEHKPLTLPPGLYEVHKVREFDPFKEDYRPVVD